MIIPPALVAFYDVILILIENMSFILYIIPQLLQLIGLIGWLWYGYQINKDRNVQFKMRGVIRSTIIWVVGLFLENLVYYYDDKFT